MERGVFVRKGELAEKLGIMKKQVDFLNRQGLLEESARTKSGQRLYDAGLAKRRYGLIKFLEKAGYNIEGIKILLGRKENG